MDDLVEQALARWPNVPSIAGWLKLTTQGQWLLTGLVPAGLTISNTRILNFIARNYAAEPDGRYYFQNGPQKAYVDLEYTPWVYHLHHLPDDGLMLWTHTGLLCWPTALYQDEQGRVLLLTELGVGLLHSADVPLLVQGLCEEQGHTQHRATWFVPDVEPHTVLDTRIRLRKPKGLPAGRCSLTLNLLAVASSDVPQRFCFQPKPTS
ncbi:MAG TPA: DUF2946 family protein [Limnobacter sp.]|nr:DUF2946 family protein [Limnobacter sp.]